ncbi:hypothetical protein ACQP1G_14815 [Nocardia sp. CA-107356]|uniref:hypothetical protein n=1 Tax=Nocardia sp. CA-107356 TaxID=3239972 RepID=UPI003D8A79D7
MVAPALALIAARTMWHARIEPLLVRVDRFLSKHADSATGWALAIAGIVLARRSDCLQVARKGRRDRGAHGRLAAFAG